MEEGEEGFGVLEFQSNDLDIKEYLWDGPDMEFGNGLPGGHVDGDKGMLEEYLNPNMSSSSSDNGVQEVETDSKRVVLAAADAAGLTKGGIRRSAFSMGDLQALQPEDQEQSGYSHAPSAPLETVHEGVASNMSSIPTSMDSVAVMPQQQYVLVPIDAAGKDGVARGAMPNQLASLSIEEIEAQLSRTREAAAVGSSGGLGAMGVQGGTAQYFTVAPIKTEAYSGNYQPGQVISMVPSTSMAAVTPVQPTVPSRAAPLSAMRRTKSAAELGGGVSPKEEDSINTMLQQSQDVGQDGITRIGKLTPEERRQKILRYRQKRHERNFKKKIKYVCRKTLADSRPRVRGRFARNTDEAAKMPVETK